MHKAEALRTIYRDHPELWVRMHRGELTYLETKQLAGLTAPAARTPVKDVDVAVGTIYCASWGYDQSNIDYYEVTATTAKTLELRPIATRHLRETGNMSEFVAPIPGTYTGASFRRRLAAGSVDAIRINQVAWASPWKGAPDLATHYA